MTTAPRTTRGAVAPEPATPFDAFEAATWEQRAAGYETFFTSITGRAIEPMLEAAAVGRGTRLVDVACGPGDLVGAAIARGADACGVDIAEAMLARARRRWPGGDFRRGDAHRLPLPTASRDVVSAGFVLMHLGRPESAAAEWHRVLVPGGRLVVAVWDRPEEVALFGELLGAMDDCGAIPPEEIPEGPSFFRFSDEDELRALLEETGFEATTISTLRWTHPLSGADALWEGILAGSVRTAATIRGQTPEVRERVRARLAERLVRHRDGDGLAVPVSVKIAAARLGAT